MVYYRSNQKNIREKVVKMSEVQNNEGCTEESCAGCAHADSCSSKKTDFREPANKYSNIKKVIGVVSGKGGVGKSLVTASLARMMRKKGYTVGILDADITGPSIPKMYGVHDKAAGAEDSSFPCVAKDETRIMSVNLLLPDADRSSQGWLNSSGQMSSGETSTICSWICRPEQATFR